MRRYRLEIDNVRSHLRSLWVVIGLQGLIILALWIGWSQAPKQLRVYVPPDLRSGAVLAAEEVPPANVYAFAFYIFQQLNRWPENGATDYGSAIFRISPYLTPRYRNDLIADMELKARRGELAYRVRGVHEVPGHGYEERRVDVLSPDVWIVWLDLDLLETVLTAYATANLWAATGWFLEAHRQTFHVDDAYLDRLEAKRPRVPQYLVRSRRGGRVLEQPADKRRRRLLSLESSRKRQGRKGRGRMLRRRSEECQPRRECRRMLQGQGSGDDRRCKRRMPQGSRGSQSRREQGR